MKGFKNFLMQGQLVIVAVGLVVALAFSTLVKAFTDSIIKPLISAAGGGGVSRGLGWEVNGQFIDVGAFLSALVYFVVFMAVVYFAIVVPYRSYMHHRGMAVFGEAPKLKTCPACLSDDLPEAAKKCKHCATELTPGALPAAFHH